MPGAVARQLQDAEAHAAEVQVVGLLGNDDIGGEALLQEILPALAVGQGHIVGPVAVRVHGDARLDEGAGGQGAPGLLEVAHIAGVVKVGVGADDAPQDKPTALQEIIQAAAVQPGIARVQQHHLPVVELIKGQQGRGGHRRIGTAQHMAQFHGKTSLAFFPIIHPKAENTSRRPRRKYS